MRLVTHSESDPAQQDCMQRMLLDRDDADDACESILRELCSGPAVSPRAPYGQFIYGVGLRDGVEMKLSAAKDPRPSQRHAN